MPDGEGHGFAFGKGRELYRQYQERLKSLNAADFGDLLLHTLTILRTQPDILADYRDRFRYMLVDEYQDTNVVQYLWLKLLATATGNVCVVGDDDQSIYGWRGAEVENILRFERDFPGAKVIRLERNYRSTPAILGAASGLIAANKGRLGKTLWTEGDPGEKIRCRACGTPRKKRATSRATRKTCTARATPSREMAILVRASFQMREFEDRFISLGLPYRVIGGPRFYERAEIRDALAYLRLIAQGDDDLAFERIVNKPKRGIGDASVQALHKFARAQQLAAARRGARDRRRPTSCRPRRARRWPNSRANFARWSETAKHLPHTEAGRDGARRERLHRHAEGRQIGGGAGAAREPEGTRPLDGGVRVARRLPRACLAGDGDRAGRKRRPHQPDDAARRQGLEFDTVFLPGWEEGLFPSQRTMDENGLAGLEEERRLAYVGLTRAQEAHPRLASPPTGACTAAGRARCPRASSPNCRRSMSTRWSTKASMAAMSASATTRNAQDFASTYDSPGWRRAQANRAASGGMRTRPPLIEAQAYAVQTSDPTATQFERGERIFHQKFGYGRVTAVEGNKLTVDFDKAGEKKVIDQFVQRA